MAPGWKPSAGVRKLYAGRRALAGNEPGDARKRFDVLIFPDSEVAWGDAAFGHNGGGFGHHQSSSALGAAAQVDEVPVGRGPVLG